MGAFDSMAFITRAWRERWTDWEFGIHLRNTMKGEAGLGDGVPLAQALLKHSLVGPGPSRSYLSYLRYCAGSGIVSGASILRLLSLEPVADGHRHRKTGLRITAVLDIMTEVLSTMPISTSSGKDECLEEAKTLLRVVDWLVKALGWAYARSGEGSADETTVVIEGTTDMLFRLLVADKFRASLVRVASFEETSISRSLSASAVANFQLVWKETSAKRDITGSLKLAVNKLKVCLFVVKDLGVPVYIPRSYLINLAAHRPALGDQPTPSGVFVGLIPILIEAHFSASPSEMARWIAHMATVKRMETRDVFKQVLGVAFSLVQNEDKGDFYKKVMFLLYVLPDVFKCLHQSVCRHEANGTCPDLEAALYVRSYPAALRRANQMCRTDLIESFAKEAGGRGLVDRNSYAQIMSNQLPATSAELQKPRSEDVTMYLAVISDKLREIAAYLSSGDQASAEIILGALVTLKVPSAGWSPLIHMASLHGHVETLVAFLLTTCESNENASLCDSSFMFLALFGLVLHDEVSMAVSSYAAKLPQNVKRTFCDYFSHWLETFGREGYEAERNCDVFVNEEALSAFDRSLTDDVDLASQGFGPTDVCVSVMTIAKRVMLLWQAKLVTDGYGERLMEKLGAKSLSAGICLYSWVIGMLKRAPFNESLECCLALNAVKRGVSSSPEFSGAKVDLFDQLISLLRQYPDGFDHLVELERGGRFNMTLPHLVGANPGQGSSGAVPGHVAPSLMNLVRMRTGGYLLNPARGETAPEDSFAMGCRGGRVNTLWREALVVSKAVKISTDVAARFVTLVQAGGMDWFVQSVVQETYSEAHAEELDHLADIMLGVFHMDISSAFEALGNFLTLVLISPSEKEGLLLEPFASRFAKLFANVTYCYFAELREQEMAEKLESMQFQEVQEYLSGDGFKSVMESKAPCLKLLFESIVKSTIGCRQPFYDMRVPFVIQILRASASIGSLTGEGSPLAPFVPLDLIEATMLTMEEELDYELLIDLIDLRTKEGRLMAAHLLFTKKRLATVYKPGVSLRVGRYGNRKRRRSS